MTGPAPQSLSPASLVAAGLAPDAERPRYTAREQANIDLIVRLRSVPFTERRRFMHPRMRHHRWGFMSLADMTGMKDGSGYDADSISGRVDTIEDIIAKDDRVWAVWTMRGVHSGQLFGIPATGCTVEVLEVGIWRVVDGLVAEAWFFGDELALLRQLGRPVDALVLDGSAQRLPRSAG